MSESEPDDHDVGAEEDRASRTLNRVPDPYTTKEAIVDLVVGLKWPLTFALVGIVVVFTAFDMWPSWEVPRSVQLFAATFGLGILGGSLPAYVIVKWLYSPDYVYLVDIDPESDDVAVHKLKPAKFADLRVESGDIHPLEATNRAFEVRSYDPVTNVATGTPRGSASDLQLLRDREEIREIRGTLEDLAQDGISLRIQLSSIVRSVSIDVIGDMIETYEQHATFSGDRVSQAVKDALDHHDIDDNLRDLDSNLNLDPETEGTIAAEQRPEYAAQEVGADD